jgi:hypothetical protein
MEAKFKIEEVKALATFCEKNNKTEFFLAKDQGLYIGQNTGDSGTKTFEKYIAYAMGCNPDLDEEWYEESCVIGGGDDFGDYLPVQWLAIAIGRARRSENYTHMTLKLLPTKIELV